MGLKVACVGLSPLLRDSIPFNVPEWEIWGLPWDKEHWPRYHRLFEIHDIRYEWMTEAYLDKLKEVDVPLYMQEAYLPNSTAYPLDRTDGYLTSSVSYMLALAIAEEAEEIAIYGVEMNEDSEYGHQRTNFEYLLGLAKGRGIKITLPEACPLLKFNLNLGCVDRYGWLG